MTITWRGIWARIRMLWRAHRLKVRYCGDCGTPLTADETITCAECIELHAVERQRQLAAQMQPNAFAAQLIAAMQDQARVYNAAAMQNANPLLAALSASEHQRRAMAQSGPLAQIPGGVLGGMLGGIGGLTGPFGRLFS